jgi:DNA-binding GntR family transcriptional regulator
MDAAVKNRRDANGVLSGKAGLILKDLERRFISGKYHFGELLSIASLAEEFDASRQPVSTAINHLRSMGYVTIVPQVGCKVVAPGKQEIADFFYILGKAEGAIAGMAASRWVDDEINQLQQIESAISDTAFDTMDHRDAYAYAYADAVDLFHYQIHDMARSPSTKSWLENLFRLADFYLWQGDKSDFSSQGVATANKERRAIMRALKQRDVSLTESLMEKHLNGKPRRVGIL